MSQWRIAAASVAGTSHLKLGTECQDNHACRVLADADGRTVVVLVASDGAGSASRAGEGSALACTALEGLVADYFERGGCIADIELDAARSWLKRVQTQIADRAAAQGLVPRDYACTLLAAILGEDAASFLQIGDGAIVVAADQAGEWTWVYWPQHGEYANTTNFVTDKNAEDFLAFGSSKGAIYEIAVFTDGIERLVLQFASKTVHAPFFDKMFVPVRALASDGLSVELSKGLEEYLSSQAVCERTDDDKTLILATRRPRHEAESKSEPM